MPKIQLRHDTSTNWTTYNPVLLEGEVGVETDTNKMKIGDGTTAYNSLDYFGGDIDLSAYYDKTQTDRLLNDKQDKLTPNAPLSISTYSKSSLVGLSYTQDGTGVYSTKIVAGQCPYTISIVPGTNLWGMACYFTGGGISGANISTVLSDMGYIDIPYTFGDIVTSTTGNIPNIWFGISDDNGNFTPIITSRAFGSDITANGILINTTENLYLQTSYVSDVGYPYFLNFRTGASDLGANTSTDTVSMFQVQHNEANDVITYRGSTNTYRLTVTDASARAVISKINTARLVIMNNLGSSASTPISISMIGKYVYDGLLNGALNISDLGENQFVVGQVIASNYIDLNIGAGLSVDNNGNLVNTNPTAPSVMTGATSSTAGTSGLVPVPTAGDDTKFLSGDGTFKAVSGPDMSNYYNKSETDALLVEKQDVFQTGQGLDLSVVSNIHGYNFIDEDTIVATSTDSTIQHIDIPYNPNSGQVVSIPSNFQISLSSFGYYNSSNEYVPVIYNFGNNAGYLSFTYLDSNGVAQSSGRCTDNRGTDASDNLLQYYNGKVCAMYPYLPPKNLCFINSNSISNTETAKINVCRLVSTDTTSQYNVNDFGLYTIGTYLAMSTGTWYTAKDNPNQFTIGSNNVMKVAVDNSTITFDSNGALSTAVDQTYNASSTNAQSGVAIAGAGFLKDNSSANTSLYIGQNYTSSREYATVIGRDISNTAHSSTCVGYATEGTGQGSVAMGYRARGQGDYSIAIGSTAITMFTQGLAIGYQALTSASHAIQLGTGTNSTQGTFQVGNYQLLDSSGKIPDARLNSTVLLTSTGVSSTSIRTIAKLTEAEYQALATKDANTFYVIVASNS